jgi:hypothetical protein
MGDPHATLRTGQSRPTSFPITRATDPLRAAGSSKRARGAAGLLLGAWGLDAIVASNPEPTAYWVDRRIDGRVLAFVVALMGVTTIAAGLIPALRLLHVDVAGGLLHGGRTGSAPGDRRLQSGLVVVQVAMTFALTVGATLLAGQRHTAAVQRRGVRTGAAAQSAAVPRRRCVRRSAPGVTCDVRAITRRRDNERSSRRAAWHTRWLGRPSYVPKPRTSRSAMAEARRRTSGGSPSS